MRSTALFFGALCGTFLAAGGYTVACKLEALSAENKELRLRDSARARVKNFKDGSVEVNERAILNASYNMGTPAYLLVAVRKQEHGSTLWEFGHKGKTAWIAEHTPPDEWQAYEAARTLNKALWRWAMKEHRKEAVKALGKAYTAEHHAAAWARNVTKLMEKQSAERP